MRSANHLLPLPLFFCVLGFLFCLWDAVGGGPQICFTAGCTLYSNVSIAGVSLWHVGMLCFFLMGALAFFGRAEAGYIIAWTGIAVDCLLLALMVATAPCFNCLIVALLLCLVLQGFYRAKTKSSGYLSSQRRPRQVVVLVWTVLFLCNVGIVLKALTPLYSLSDNADEARVNMFFSPTCPSCRQGIMELSGSVDVDFYPVAEKEMDVPRIARMKAYLDSGMSMKDALEASKDYTDKKGPTGMAYCILALKLLCNEAHVYLNAGQVVPYFEYKGLPAHLKRKKAPAQSQTPQVRQEKLTGDPTIPLGNAVDGACFDGTKNCEDETSGGMMRRK